MHLTPNMYKIVNLKANAKKIITWKCIWHQIYTKLFSLNWNAQEIITWKCIWHQICTKSLLWMQMLSKPSLENPCGTTYVQNHYFEGKCLGNCYIKMHMAPNMYKFITVKANAKKIVRWKCIWCQICTKSVTLKANAKKIITRKCVSHQICTKSWLWRQMLRK